MECLYCGASLGLLSRGEFCNKKHQELWRAKEAELSIQRLKEAFSYQKAAEKPAPLKPRPTSVSVLDSTPRDPVPPPEFFAHDEPPQRKVEAPVDPPADSPFSPEFQGVSEKAGVFYCAPASDPGAPPDAGFVSTVDLTKTLWVPFSNRRPTLPKREAEDTPLASDWQSIQASLALPIIDERLGFLPAVSIAAIEGCATRQFGPSIPQPSLNVPPMVAVPVQLRNAAIRSIAVFGTPLQACTITPRKPKASAQETTSRVPYELHPAALSQRDLPPADRLPSCGFRRLPGARIAPAELPAIPTTTLHGRQQNLGSAAMPPPPRTLEFERAQAIAFVLQPCKAMAEQSQGGALTLSRPNPEPQPPSLRNREIEGRLVRAQDPEILQASLPRSTAPQPTGSLYAPRTVAFTVARSNAAPPVSPFQALKTSQFVRDQTRFAATPCAEVERKLAPAQIQGRLFDLPVVRAPLSRIEAFAAKTETAKATIQRAAKRVFETKPAALHQREIREQTSPFVPYAEARPAICSCPRARRTQATGHTPAPRRVAIAIGRKTLGLPNRTFQKLAIRESTPGETKPALLPCTDSPSQKIRGKFAQVQSRKLEFPGSQTSTAALQVSAMPAEKTEAKMCRASERTYEAPPLPLLWRTLEPQPVDRRYRQVMPANLPRAIGTRPHVATRTQSLPVALGRLIPALPDCAFRALDPHSQPTLPKATTRPCASPAIRTQPLSLALGRLTPTLPDCGFHLWTDAQTAQAHSKSTVRLCTDLAKGLSEAVQLQRRKLSFRDSHLFSDALAIRFVAALADTLKSSLNAAPGQIERRPLALRLRIQEHGAAVARWLDIVPVWPQRTVPAPPPAAHVNAVRVLGIFNRRAGTVLPNCAFYALETSPGASPMHARTAAIQPACTTTMAFRVPARQLSLTAPAPTFQSDHIDLEPRLDTRDPEFVARVNHKTYPLSRPLLAWDSEWMELVPFSTGSNAGDADLAQAAPSTVSRTATWAQPGNAVSLRLYLREIAAAAHAGGSGRAPAPRRDIRWVAQKVPWAPRP